MGRLILRRLLAIVPLLLTLSIIAFAVLQLLPGDPVLVRVGDNAPQDVYEAARSDMGLDRALPVQYLTWLGDALRGDFGRSLTSSQSVSTAIRERMPVTLSITLGSVLMGFVLGVGAGILAATRPGKSTDRAITFVATIGLAVPNFWFAILLVVPLSLTLGWFPATGFTGITESVIDWARSIALPSAALGLSAAATIARQTRSALIQSLQQDYIRTAIAKGAGRRRIIFKHGLKNAMIPVVTVLAFQVTALLGGALVVEQVFALPGLGSLAVGAVQRGDVTMVQGVIMYSAVVVVLVNLVLDILYGWLNPKVRAE